MKLKENSTKTKRHTEKEYRKRENIISSSAAYHDDCFGDLNTVQSKMSWLPSRSDQTSTHL